MNERTIFDSANAKFYGIQAATCGKMTYIRNFKCASTFFYQNLVEVYRWQEIKFNEIDWTSRVFAHIRNPYERRFMGIAHWLRHGLGITHIDNDIIYTLINNSPFFDIHSSSYSDTYGEHCYEIDWIPMDIFDHKTVIDLTDVFLRSYGQFTLKGWDTKYAHDSDPEVKALYLQIKNKSDTNANDAHVNKPNYAIYRYFLKDIELYNTVLKKFNPVGQIWDEITWLQKD